MSETNREYLSSEIRWCLHIIESIKKYKKEADALRVATVTYILYTKPIDENVVQTLKSMAANADDYMMNNISSLEDRLKFLPEDIWPSTSFSPNLFAEWDNPERYVDMSPIEAIKLMREKKGIDLKSAKDKIDEWRQDGTLYTDSNNKLQKGK